MLRYRSTGWKGVEFQWPYKAAFGPPALPSEIPYRRRSWWRQPYA